MTINPLFCFGKYVFHRIIFGSVQEAIPHEVSIYSPVTTTVNIYTPIEIAFNLDSLVRQ
jgi:hypothetical protein